MKTFIIILVIVVVLALGYKYGKKAIDNFDFGNPKFVGADLKSIFSSSGFATVDLSTTITNKNNFSVPVNNLYIEVYYQGALVGKSTTPHDAFVIPKNGSINISQNISLAVTNTVNIAAQIIGGQSVQFEYRIRAILFGFVPFFTKGTFTY